MTVSCEPYFVVTAVNLISVIKLEVTGASRQTKCY